MHGGRKVVRGSCSHRERLSGGGERQAPAAAYPQASTKPLSGQPPELPGGQEYCSEITLDSPSSGWGGLWQVTQYGAERS